MSQPDKMSQCAALCRAAAYVQAPGSRGPAASPQESRSGQPGTAWLANACGPLRAAQRGMGTQETNLTTWAMPTLSDITQNGTPQGISPKDTFWPNARVLQRLAAFLSAGTTPCWALQSASRGTHSAARYIAEHVSAPARTDVQSLDGPIHFLESRAPLRACHVGCRGAMPGAARRLALFCQTPLCSRAR